MRSPILSGVSVLLALLLTLAASADAQVRAQPPANAQTIVARLERASDEERGVAVAAAAAIMARKTPGVTAATADSVADGLAAAAIAYPSAVAGDALAALLGAAKSQPTPYRGAFDRFVRVMRNAANPGVRGAALESLAEIGQIDRAIPVWEALATQNPTDPAFIIGPSRAVEYLCRYGGAKGRAILTDLYRRDAVKDNPAAGTLAVYVQHGFNCP